MADIRIKDLTTTASSTASGDFFVIDGTTGTRKVNAFNPSFGGNATVTGTLTVNGATGSLGSSASAATSLKLTVGVGTNASPKYRTIDFRNYDDSKSQAYIRAANRETDSNASTIEVAARSPGDVLTSIATFSDSQLSIAATTASTSTSSGALVVGNGTSGGLGVGGAVFTGGYVHPGGDSNFYIRATGSSNGLIRANFLSADVASGFLVRNDTGTTDYVRIDSTGLIAAIPATAPSLTVNGTMTFERTSNTSLKISVRGTDGTTRSVSLTLA